MDRAKKEDLYSINKVHIFHEDCKDGKVTYIPHQLAYRCEKCNKKWALDWIRRMPEDEIEARFIKRPKSSETVYKIIEVEDGKNRYSKLAEVPKESLDEPLELELDLNLD